MFQFPAFPFMYYFTYTWISRLFSLDEFPHSDICESMDICSSSQLFAAYHVLLRLLMPRHSPYALCSLTFRFFQTFGSFSVLFLKNFPFKIGSSFILLPSSLCILYIFQCAIVNIKLTWWAQMESNHRPHAYQACALTIWAMSPYCKSFL